jgi:transposase
MAKASLECPDANGMRKAPHPPHSPDLAPIDFSYSEMVRRLTEPSFENPDDLLSGIETILSTTEKSIPIAVYQNWVRRVRLCIDGHEEYVA